jgi:hypothetical protein
MSRHGKAVSIATERNFSGRPAAVPGDAGL